VSVGHPYDAIGGSFWTTPSPSSRSGGAGSVWSAQNEVQARTSKRLHYRFVDTWQFHFITIFPKSVIKRHLWRNLKDSCIQTCQYKRTHSERLRNSHILGLMKSPLNPKII
jgi:hypothetical protein